MCGELDRSLNNVILICMFQTQKVPSGTFCFKILLSTLFASMTSLTPDPKASSSTSVKKQPIDLEDLVRDSSHIFYFWFTALILMLSMMILHRHISVLIYIVITTFLFIYLWVLLLARLDQLASRIEGIPRNLVYKTLLIPVLGTLASYHFILRHAQKIIVK